METFDKMIKNATKKMKDTDKDIDNNVTVLDQSLNLLTEIEDDISTSNYVELVENRDKMDEISSLLQIRGLFVLSHTGLDPKRRRVSSVLIRLITSTEGDGNKLHCMRNHSAFAP